MNLKRILKFSKNKKKVQSEEEYYENLFVRNSLWNTPTPNIEEALRWEVIDKLVKEVQEQYISGNDKSLKILDLGCGRGWLTNLLTKYGEAIGVEPVKEVVVHAKKMFPSINFISGTSKDLLNDGKKGAFHLVVSSEVIEHIPDKDKNDFVQDIYDLLDKDGFVVLTTQRQEAQQEWHQYLSADQPIEDWISEQELESLLVKNNFKKLQLKRLAMAPPVKGAPQVEIYQL